MIRREKVDGKPASVAYLKADLTPAEPEDAELVRVMFDNGDTAWLTPQREDGAGFNDYGTSEGARKAAMHRPRTFYKGSKPGDTRRISTETPEWDQHLFASSDPEAAKDYGHHITKIEAKPEAKIIYEGTPEWNKVAGRQKRNENLLQYATRAALAAKAAGYHAAHFQRQSDVGTAIFHPDKFSFSE